MTFLKLVLSTTFGLVAIGGFATAANEDHCLNGIAPALVSGGFSGSVDCRSDQLSARNIGQVRTWGRIFTIYDYRYRLAPVCDDCAIHGGQRIIFMDRGRYVGQYKPYSVRVTIRQGNLLLVPEAESGSGVGTPVTIKFTRRGPPRQILVDGELLEFFR